MSKSVERWPSWSKAHDWKSCIPQNGIKGSNPFLSAKKAVTPVGVTAYFFWQSERGFSHCAVWRDPIIIVDK